MQPAPPTGKVNVKSNGKEQVITSGMPLSLFCGKSGWNTYPFFYTKNSKYSKYLSVRIKVVTQLLNLEHFPPKHPPVSCEVP